MKKNYFLILLFSISIFSGCQPKDEIQELCDNYNNMSPVMIDAQTELLGAVYTDSFFGFHYKIKGYESDEAQDMITQVFLEMELEKQVKKPNAELDLIRKKGLNLAYQYKDKNDKLCIYVFFSVNQSGEFYLNKELRDRMIEMYKKNNL
ncbi:hypothetical protein OAX32_03025 [Flavobacteriales bacterium]|nr:hypothetical protein [Flavobacteriales bacterium]